MVKVNMNLPQTGHLPIKHLSKVFNKTTNSYKFYWFFAILECVGEQTNSLISVNSILSKMISNVWYPINYFKISFGKQDRLEKIVLQVKAEICLPVDANPGKVLNAVLNLLDNESNIALQNNLNSLTRFVPYRFLRSWFKEELRGLPDYQINTKIIEFAKKGFHDKKNRCLYRFQNGTPKYIEIPISWFEYLKKHNKILMDFCLWNLLSYLQKNNPTVPNIAGKLFAPQTRNLTRARKFWDMVFDEYLNLSCIYSDSLITKSDYSIDHFIPWRFVTHDLYWNLIPTPKFINSSKSDSLPSLEKYFDKFAKTQHQAFKIIFKRKQMKLLEDYSNICHCELIDIYEMSEQNFKERLYSSIAPLTQIAENIGFETNWIFK